MSPRDNRERVKLMLAKAEQAGCVVSARNNNHYKILTPSGAVVYCASTPSCYRGVLRTVSLLRRHGVEVRL